MNYPLYLITEHEEVTISRSLFETCEDHLNPVILSKISLGGSGDSRCPLTQHLSTHFADLASLKPETFDWKYYLSKNPDLRALNPTALWKHWCDTGRTHLQNPLNRYSIWHNSDIQHISAFVTILADAIRQHVPQILILDLTQINTSIDLPDLPKVLKELSPVIKTSDVCIFTHSSKVNYAYLLKAKTYESLFLELSCFTTPFNYLIDAYLTTYQPPYQIIDHQTVQEVELVVCELHDPLIVPEREITKLRNRLMSSKVKQFIREHPAQEPYLTQMIAKFPYQWVKTHWNRDLNVDFEHYLLLCLSIPTRSYFSHLKIRSPEPIHGDELNVIYFDRDFYLSVYPCYQKVFKTYVEAYNHYVNHGINEKLLPNRALFSMIQWSQEWHCHDLLSQMTMTTTTPLKPVTEATAGSTPPLIYILTRTCQRPKLFAQCVESILSQKYSNLRHLVSYDQKDTLTYIQEYPHIHQVIDLCAKKGKLHPNQYLDEFYTYTKDPGWVLILDDDDKLMTPNALHYLAQYLTDPKMIVIWMLYRPDKFIYPANKENPVVGEIGSCCYLCHTSVIQKGHWGGSAVGDFTFFRYLFTHVKQHTYLDLPLTGVNYVDEISGWTAM